MAAAPSTSCPPSSAVNATARGSGWCSAALRSRCWCCSPPCSPCRSCRKRAAVARDESAGRARAPEAESTSLLANELERQVADYNFLLARKHGSYSALAIVEEISRLLPDNTWVQQLDIRTVGKTREVQIVGETASASKLIEILEGSTLLQVPPSPGDLPRPIPSATLIAAEVRGEALIPCWKWQARAAPSCSPPRASHKRPRWSPRRIPKARRCLRLRTHVPGRRRRPPRPQLRHLPALRREAQPAQHRRRAIRSRGSTVARSSARDGPVHASAAAPAFSPRPGRSLPLATACWEAKRARFRHPIFARSARDR